MVFMNAEHQIKEIMTLLDDLGVPKDHDPVNRVKYLTGAYTAVKFYIKRTKKAVKDLNRIAKLNRK